VATAQTVVVVDDDQDTVELLVLYLEQHGLVAEGFTDAEAAMQRLSHGPEPCLLVVDYKLGEIQGDEFVRLAREKGVTSPIVVITAAHPAHINVRALLQLGVAQVMTKPFDPDALEKVVETQGRQGCR